MTTAIFSLSFKARAQAAARALLFAFACAAIVAAGLVASSCAPGPSPVARRASVNDIDGAATGLDAIAPESLLRSPLAPENAPENAPGGGQASPRACARLAELRALPAMPRRYAYLGGAGVDDAGKPWIAIDVGASPFVQLALAEKFQLDSLAGFVKLAEEARARGEIGNLQWAAFWAARETWQTTGLETPLRLLQLRATNGKIAEAFPGVFGAPGPPDKALAALLVRKLDPTTTLLADHEAIGVLLARTNLFNSGEWTAFADDVERSLRAAISSYAFDPTFSPLERSCSFTLVQRAFAQLLALKGYEGLFTRPAGEGRPWSRTEEIDATTLGFRKQTKPGAFVDVAGSVPGAGGRRVALAGERIAAYDPAQGLVRLAKGAPTIDGEAMDAAPSAGADALRGELAFLRAMALMYEATSPAAPWASEPGRYLLGDVQSLQNRAVIPDDAHALAAGLFILQLKNLAAERLVPVVASGRAARPGEPPAGVVTVASVGGARRVRLDDVTALLEALVPMDQALRSFARPGVARDDWAKLAPFYAPSTLALLFGPILFTDAELRQALPPAALGATLKDNLDRLKLPLAALAFRLLDAGVAEIAWTPERGVGAPLAPLTSEARARAKAALLRLAANAQSSALAERARRF